MRLISNTIQQTRAFGARCARQAARGDVYALIGSLGCGKTEFVRGFVAALAPKAPVRSPSFALVYVYETPLFPVCHFDFYRLKNMAELVGIGFEDYLRDDCVCCIEWADMFMDALPQNTRKIYFSDNGPDSRILESDLPFAQE